MVKSVDSPINLQIRQGSELDFAIVYCQSIDTHAKRLEPVGKGEEIGDRYDTRRRILKHGGQ